MSEGKSVTGKEPSAGHVNLDDLASKLLPSLPALDAEEQAVSIRLLQLLAKGSPVARSELAASLHLPVSLINGMLDQWWGVYCDEQNRVTGYWGLTVTPTQHSIRINGESLYAWCAWDALFLPGLLNATAAIESRCPRTNNRIQLTLGPDGLQDIQPAGVVVSFLVPDSDDVHNNIVAHFCHFVYFFESKDAGLAWAANRPDTIIMGIEDAYILGQKVNRAIYADIL